MDDEPAPPRRPGKAKPSGTVDPSVEFAYAPITWIDVKAEWFFRRVGFENAEAAAPLIAGGHFPPIVWRDGVAYMRIRREWFDRLCAGPGYAVTPGTRRR